MRERPHKSVAQRSAPRAADLRTIKRILAPVGLDSFLRYHWETRPLHVSRRSVGYFSRLLTLADVVTLLTSMELRQADIRLVRDGAPLPANAYTRPLPWADGTVDGVVLTDRVFAEYHAGTTIIVEALQRKWPPLAQLCRELETFFHQGVQANVYLTPKNSQGFTAHYDTHDVFVLQIAGSKHWRIYPPVVELPLASQPTLSEAEIKQQIGEPTHQLNLREGDCLYLPRGYVHEAMAADEPSLHITVGVIAVTWSEMLSQALASVSGRDVRFRQSLPVGFGRAADRDPGIAKHFAALVSVLREATDVSELIQQMFERFVCTRLPILDGHFDELAKLDEIDLRTRVIKRPGLLSGLKSDQSDVSLTFHGKQVSFPRRIEPVLRFISAARSPFTAASLPGTLDDEGRLVLIRRLVKEGYLTTACPR